MYSITSRDRRITDFVMEQAYIWLYEQIKANEYVAGDRNSENLLLDIKKAGEITEDSYDTFKEAFINDPYTYLMRCGNGKKFPGITSKNLANYFVKFNDSIIPIGFIQSFFEDDYEVKADVVEFYNQYLDASLEDFSINCQIETNKKSEQVEKIKMQNPGVFDTKLGFHICNVIKLVLVIIGLVLSIGYFDDIDIIDRTKALIAGTISVDGLLYRVPGGLKYIIANAVLLTVMLVKLGKLIRVFMFYIKLIRIRTYIFFLQRSFSAFNSDTIEEFKEYFKGVNDALRANDFKLTDDMCTTAPAGRKKYLAIVNFNENKVLNKVYSLVNNKKYRMLHFYYTNAEELRKIKPLWKSGIISSVLLVIVFAFINVPALNQWLVETWNSFFAKS